MVCFLFPLTASTVGNVFIGSSSVAGNMRPVTKEVTQNYISPYNWFNGIIWVTPKAPGYRIHPSECIEITGERNDRSVISSSSGRSRLRIHINNPCITDEYDTENII